MGCPRIYFVAIKRPKDMDNSEHENPNPRPKWLAIADNGLGSVINGAALISAILVLVLMILVTADIIGRYVFSKPVPMTYEIGSFLMVFIVFLGIGYTQRMKAHIRVEFFTLRLPPRIKAGLDLLALTLGFILYVAIFYQGMKWSYTSFQVGDYVAGLVNLPRWPSQFAIPLGALLLSLQFASDFVDKYLELLRIVKSPKSGNP